MNFNEVAELQARMRHGRARLHAVPTPQDIQRAELALQAVGSPAWDVFHVYIQQCLTETQQALSTLKDRWAVAYNLPHEDAYMHQQAAAMQARIATLIDLRDYLPTLVKQAHDANL